MRSVIWSACCFKSLALHLKCRFPVNYWNHTPRLGIQTCMKTVLIVDDEPLIRAYVRDVVEDAGYKAKEACTADEALQLIDDDGIDIVLSDIEMPGSLDGVELAWTVRNRWPEKSVILASGRRLPR